MDTQNLKIKKEDIVEARFIYVEDSAGVKNPVVTTFHASTISFTNDLATGKIARLYFYPTGVKKTPKNAIKCFCKGQTDVAIEIPYGTTFSCEILETSASKEKASVFKYAIEATGYEELDPVIIIEPGIDPHLGGGG